MVVMKFDDGDDVKRLVYCIVLITKRQRVSNAIKGNKTNSAFI